MMERLSARDRRALVVAAAALLVALVIHVGRPVVRDISDLRSRIEAERELFAEEAAVRDASEKIVAAHRAASERLSAHRDRMLVAEEPGVAGANLTRYVRSVAEASRVYLATGEPRARVDTLPGGLTAVHVGGEGETDFEGLLSFLHALEFGPTLVRITSLSAELVASPGSMRGEGPEILKLHFEVRGIRAAQREEPGGTEREAARQGGSRS